MCSAYILLPATPVNANSALVMLLLGRAGCSVVQGPAGHSRPARGQSLAAHCVCILFIFSTSKHGRGARRAPCNTMGRPGNWPIGCREPPDPQLAPISAQRKCFGSTVASRTQPPAARAPAAPPPFPPMALQAASFKSTDLGRSGSIELKGVTGTADKCSGPVSLCWNVCEVRPPPGGAPQRPAVSAAASNLCLASNTASCLPTAAGAGERHRPGDSADVPHLPLLSHQQH